MFIGAKVLQAEVQSMRTAALVPRWIIEGW
jgi:hypothetical protein